MSILAVSHNSVLIINKHMMASIIRICVILGLCFFITIKSQWDCIYDAYGCYGEPEIDDKIWCYGDSACANVDALYTPVQTTGWFDCRGCYSCWNSTIVHGADCSGHQSCSHSTWTDYQSGCFGYRTVTVAGYDGGKSLDIWCNRNGDRCHVKCFGTACGSTALWCYYTTTCSVDCNDTVGISCPTFDVYYTPTSLPSTIPTSQPTNMPTGPSLLPTAAPSFSPTISPTNAPIDSPSTAPMNSPSMAPTRTPSNAPSVAR